MVLFDNLPKCLVCDGTDHIFNIFEQFCQFIGAAEVAEDDLHLVMIDKRDEAQHFLYFLCLQSICKPRKAFS